VIEHDQLGKVRVGEVIEHDQLVRARVEVTSHGQLEKVPVGVEIEVEQKGVGASLQVGRKMVRMPIC